MTDFLPDNYPAGLLSTDPGTWPDQILPANWRELHEEQSPSTPYALVESQAGAIDTWGGVGFEPASALINEQFMRVCNKELYSFGVTILNLYMVYGGSNWGNLGFASGYSSYDYSAAIRENREVNREKYSELKLQASFFKVSPAYLNATRGAASNTTWTTSSDLSVTPATGETSGFYFVRHAVSSSLDSTRYKLMIPTKAFGNVTLPQINGTSLTLIGRDMKTHVSDYDIGGANLVYSTAEIFTWHKYADKTVLVVYGGPGETHELALAVSGLEVLEGDVKSDTTRGYTILNFNADGMRKVAKLSTDSNFIYVYMLDRNDAYNYWSVDQGSHDSSNPIILKAGYLTRTANVTGNTLALTGDLNATTPIEVIGGATSSLTKLTFNGKEVDIKVSDTGVVMGTVDYTSPNISVPQLNDLEWKYIDSLPEIQSSYDDTQWQNADLKTTYNTFRPLNTPVSLYSADYGYHSGALIYRGTFTATGNETELSLTVQGGTAYGTAGWLGTHFLGSWHGDNAYSVGTSKWPLSNLTTAGQTYTLTLVVDSQGYDMNWVVGGEQMKNPRGILDYDLSGHANSDITWKITGNLGGEDYRDVSRGPINEGGLFAERHGLHLPGAMSGSNATWSASKGPVIDGLSAPGIGFFATEFNLNLPAEYDIPLSLSITNTPTGGSTPNPCRVQLYVNGWQFGKFVSTVGPQTKFPVPQGVLDYQGVNYLAVTFWGLDKGTTKLGGLELSVDAVVWSAIGDVRTVGQGYEGREGAY